MAKMGGLLVGLKADIKVISCGRHGLCECRFIAVICSSAAKDARRKSEKVEP